MAIHSSILAWRIPGTEEPGGLPSVGLHRVKHDWCDLAAEAAAYLKTNSKWFKDLNLSPTCIKLLEVNVQEMFLEIGPTNDLPDITPKAQATK